MSGRRTEGPQAVTQSPLQPGERLMDWFTRHETYYKIDYLEIKHLEGGGWRACIEIRDYGEILIYNPGNKEDVENQVMKEWKEKWRPNPKPKTQQAPQQV